MSGQNPTSYLLDIDVEIDAATGKIVAFRQRSQQEIEAAAKGMEQSLQRAEQTATTSLGNVATSATKTGNAIQGLRPGIMLATSSLSMMGDAGGRAIGTLGLAVSRLTVFGFTPLTAGIVAAVAALELLGAEHGSAAEAAKKQAEELGKLNDELLLMKDRAADARNGGHAAQVDEVRFRTADAWAKLNTAENRDYFAMGRGNEDVYGAFNIAKPRTDANAPSTIPQATLDAMDRYNALVAIRVELEKDLNAQDAAAAEKKASKPWDVPTDSDWRSWARTAAASIPTMGNESEEERRRVEEMKKVDDYIAERLAGMGGGLRPTMAFGGGSGVGRGDGPSVYDEMTKKAVEDRDKAMQKLLEDEAKLRSLQLGTSDDEQRLMDEIAQKEGELVATKLGSNQDEIAAREAELAAMRQQLQVVRDISAEQDQQRAAKAAEEAARKSAVDEARLVHENAKSFASGVSHALSSTLTSDIQSGSFKPFFSQFGSELSKVVIDSFVKAQIEEPLTNSLTKTGESGGFGIFGSIFGIGGRGGSDPSMTQTPDQAEALMQSTGAEAYLYGAKSMRVAPRQVHLYIADGAAVTVNNADSRGMPRGKPARRAT